MYSLKTNPWKHQWFALDYVMTHNVAAIFTDMGSGKTKIMIDLIQNRDFGLVLIVGTKKACDVWEDEFKVHSFGKNPVYKLSKMSTPDKVSFIKEKFTRGQIRGSREVIIVNYDSVWIKPFSDLLLKLPIDCIICDESHRIKSPSSKSSRFLARFNKKVGNRYILSGTPTSESPLDIYGQYRFLDPSIFGTNFGSFRNRYTNIDQRRSAFCGFPVLDKKEPYKNLEELKEKMYSCAFYMTSDVELPEVNHVYVDCYMSKKAQTIYRELDEEGVYEDEQGVLETNNILAKQTRLQQLLSGYLSVEDLNFTKKELIEKDTSKQDGLKQILENISFDEKIVVFAKFRKDFEAIQNVCKTTKRRYGEISGQRDDYSKWKQGGIDVIAVHYSSGSESISLVEAKYCVYYSHTFSYGKYLQSIKRTHRPGQKRPVTYYHIISKVEQIKTVDEKIQEALEQKKGLKEYLMEQGM